MIRPSELEGVDAAWLAVDRLGQVALFTTAGQGPVPVTAIPSTEIAEEDVLALPTSCEAILLIPYQRPGGFLAAAARGFFAYDWSDVHRASRVALDGYELAAVPNKPVRIAQLSSVLQHLASATCLASIEFGHSPLVPVTSLGT